MACNNEKIGQRNLTKKFIFLFLRYIKNNLILEMFSKFLITLKNKKINY